MHLALQKVFNGLLPILAFVYLPHAKVGHCKLHGDCTHLHIVHLRVDVALRVGEKLEELRGAERLV